MKKKSLFAGMLGMVLVFGFVLTGCPTGNDPTNNDPQTELIVYTSSTADGKPVELFITTPVAARAAVTLPNGSTYVLKIDGIVVSSGTVFTENGVATFTSAKGHVFTAEVGDDEVAIIGSITTDTGDTITLPDFGHKNDSYHDEYPFTLSNDGAELTINIFGRGDGTTETPDVFVLESEGAGDFPIGKWVNENEEFLSFTTTTLTQVSPWFDTYRYDYSIVGANLVLSSIYRVPYIPTVEEQAYIDNFNEAAFRTEHLWIPSTSTINPKATKPGYDYQIVDHPDMTFIDDSDVIGTWLVCDYLNDYDAYEDYNPANPISPGINFWAGLKFEANGVLLEKYRDDTEWSGGAKWTKNILQTGRTAPTYIIQTYDSDHYIFVQWKSGDYTVRAAKPGCYVFKKSD